jgi:hypothetical protein
MEGWPAYTLKREGKDITKVYHEAKGYLYGIFKILQPLMSLIAHNERQRTVNALKKSLESIPGQTH